MRANEDMMPKLLICHGHGSKMNFSVLDYITGDTTYLSLHHLCMQDGMRACRLDFFLFSLVKIKVFDQKFQKSIKVQDGIRVCRLDFFKKIISFAA